MLAAAKQAASLTLQLDLGDSRANLYTLDSDEGDVLVARWDSLDFAAPAREVWLWDTPFYTTFVLAVGPDVMASEALRNFFEGLLVWDKDPIHFTSLRLEYLNADRGAERVGGLGKYIQTERGSWHAWFAAAASGNGGHVAVGMSKAMFSYPPEASGVRERFPPLRLRLADVPRPLLFAELGKGYVAPQILTYPTNRDAIVVGELLARGPVTDAELRQIIIGSFDSGDAQSGDVVNNRVIAFLRAVQPRGELALYTAALEKVFLEAPIQRGLQGAVMGHVIAAMEANRIDFNHGALAFLARGKYARMSLYYLQRHVQDDETLQRLLEIRVEADLEAEKQATVDHIKRRLGSSQ